jgi:hypothetical protein
VASRGGAAVTPAPDEGRSWWRLLLGFQCLGAVHLPSCLPPRDRSGEHPETVIPLASLSRRERQQFARWQDELH